VNVIAKFARGLEVPLGPKYWRGGHWLPGIPPGLDCRKKTAVLVHGILSSVEDAFDARDLVSKEGYEQVLGFDYDWTAAIDDSGAQLAEFLATVKRATRCPAGAELSIDIHAHSLGTVVSLSAACRSSVRIRNMVLYGGPITGTPLANIASGWTGSRRRS